MRESRPRAGVADQDRVRADDLLVLALGLAAAAGLVHLATVFVRHEWLGRITFSGRDLAWMAQLGYPLILVSVALPLMVVVGLVRRPLVGRAAVFALAVAGAYGMLLHATMLHPLALMVLAAGVGVRVQAWLGAHPASARPRLRRVSAVAVALGVLVGGGSFAVGSIGEWRALRALPEAPEGAPNVLIVLLDTVRAASMSLYGHDRPTTPNLDAFAQGATTFDRAMAPAPWTLPTHASLFTGRWPDELSSRWQVPLDDADQTLAEYLRARGYATGGFVANIWYAAKESGLARGFIHYRARQRTLEQMVWSTTLAQIPVVRQVLESRRPPQDILRPDRWRWLPQNQAYDRKWAPEVVDNFLEWQAGVGDRPFLAFLNIFDAHDPYWPPEGWRTRFAAEPTERDAYEGAIAFADAALGRLFREMDARGILDNTVVVVTSDHGEQFGEHGLTSHGNSLYLPVLHVPLLIRDPEAFGAGTRVEEPVSLRDVPATILDLADIPGPGLPGHSLAPLVGELPGEAAAPWPALAWVEASPGGLDEGPDEPTDRGEMHSAFIDRWHYILNGDGVEELYDVVADPDELRNLARDPQATTALALLRRALRDRP